MLSNMKGDLQVEELLKRIRRLVNDGLKSGRAKKDIMRQVSDELARWDLNGQKEALYKQMEKQFDWVDRKTMDGTEREMVGEILANAGSQYTSTKKGLRKDLENRVRPLLDAGKDRKDIRNELESVIGKHRNYAETIARTAIAGFDGADTVVKAKQAGLSRFTYKGPPAERGFCRAVMKAAAEGKTWTEEEIKGMSNGQGLDVLLYCGGFNCRHYWGGVE